jgi:hypothetical protein
MDLDAVLARHPEVALVDGLAHTNVPGCRNPKRWQDVDELLDAGINVITTLNIQHLESLNDVAMQVTGVEQHEKLPDEIARRADQIELVTCGRSSAGKARGCSFPARSRSWPASATGQCEQAIRNYDPCISCAAHFLDLTVERSS